MLSPPPLQEDKESLAELHQYLTTELSVLDEITPTRTSFDPPDAAGRATTRSERRRSLPTRSSSLSLASQYTLSTPEPEMLAFQARRRRAAKLTSFFGVDYRDLMGDIIESIEHGVEEEGHRGSLKPDEVQVRSPSPSLPACTQRSNYAAQQDLLQKLRRLKSKRNAK